MSTLNGFKSGNRISQLPPCRGNSLVMVLEIKPFEILLKEKRTFLSVIFAFARLFRVNSPSNS